MISEGKLEEGFNAYQQMLEIRRKGLALCLLLFLIAADWGLQGLSAAPASISIGVTQILAGPDSGNANLLLAQKATLSQAATIQSLSFYVAQAAGTLRLGIYGTSGTSPGALLASTNSFTTILGWNTANVITPVVLQPGTYWLAYLPSVLSLKSVTITSFGLLS